MKDITLQQVREAKQRLQSEIHKSINDFETLTGLEARAIEVYSEGHRNIEGNTMIICVKVHVSPI